MIARFHSVAPFAGAWIEITIPWAIESTACVAPFAGAWIEIGGICICDCDNFVAPFAGAWIEILDMYRTDCLFSSLPSRERGLKLFLTFLEKSMMNRRSLRGSVD